MFIFEKHPIDCAWEEIEIGWIRTGRAMGFKLTNGTDGGDGVKNITPAVREKMSAWQRGRKLTDEHKRKVGLKSVGRVHSPEWKENMRNAMKGRKILWADKVGKSNQKLTDDQVREIRKLLDQDVSQYALADQFHVHQGTISNIKRGVSYGHVT